MNYNFKLLYVNDIPYINMAELIQFLKINGNKTDIEKLIIQLNVELIKASIK